jgi:hypothetical protein
MKTASNKHGPFKIRIRSLRFQLNKISEEHKAEGNDVYGNICVFLCVYCAGIICI